MGYENIQQEKEVYISDLRKKIDNSIIDTLLNMPPLEISPLIKYATNSDGKRLRPIISILAGQSAGADMESLMNLALAFEMLHTATLVHDDIIDADNVRRNIPSINEKWGSDSAILVGDALISIAIGLSADYGGRVIKIVSEHGMQLCNGEYLDLSADTHKITVEGYLKKINNKSASLFKAVARSGAIVASADNEVVDALSEFGENFGMAYQISDDIIDINPDGNSVPKDIAEGRITLPLVYTYNRSNPGDKRKLEDIILKMRKDGASAMNMQAAMEIVAEMNSNGSVEYCKEAISGYVSAGKSAIESIQDNIYKRYLENMIDSLGKGRILPI